MEVIERQEAFDTPHLGGRVSGHGLAAGQRVGGGGGSGGVGGAFRLAAARQGGGRMRLLKLSGGCADQGQGASGEGESGAFGLAVGWQERVVAWGERLL